MSIIILCGGPDGGEHRAAGQGVEGVGHLAPLGASVNNH